MFICNSFSEVRDNFSSVIKGMPTLKNNKEDDEERRIRGKLSYVILTSQTQKIIDKEHKE